MVLITRYSALRKQDLDKKFRCFSSLRAVGLAVELGHKEAQKKGLLAVETDDLLQVTVAGKLQVQQGRNLVDARKATLTLRLQDAELAKAVVVKQLSLLSSLHLNVWKVDKQVGARTLDLLGAFHTTQNYGVNGQVWVETKVFSGKFFAKELEKSRDTLEEVLQQEEDKRSSTFGGVLLLAVKATERGHRWAPPRLVCQLLTNSGGKWQTLSGQSPKAGRGQCRAGKKPTLKHTFQEMEWPSLTSGVRVGLLKHFLEALKLPTRSAGKRAATFNRQLRKHKVKGRLSQEKLPQKCGRRPWVASRATFEQVYKFL